MGRSGPASLLPVFTLPLLLTAEAGLLLRVVPAAPSLQILKVIRCLSSEDFPVPVLVQQRGGADEDEEAHSHDDRTGQFHPLDVGAPASTHGLWRCRDVASHCYAHPHQHHHDTQQQPHAWSRTQVQFGMEGFTSPQVSVACWEANR